MGTKQVTFFLYYLCHTNVLTEFSVLVCDKITHTYHFLFREYLMIIEFSQTGQHGEMKDSTFTHTHAYYQNHNRIWKSKCLKM